LIHDQSPGVLFLSETKSPPPQVSAILNILGFFLMIQVASCGASGGLVVAWRPGIYLKGFITNKNNISAWCYSNSPHSPWILSCVYGTLHRREKQAFWDSFTSVGENFVTPWLCIGDLNSILSQSEKLGGMPVANSACCIFKCFVDQLGLIDLGFTRNPYT
jgi:hypothetical protein